MLRDHSPVYHVCLTVTLVYYGQTVGWIRMSLGMEVDLGPGDIVGDPALPAERGTAAPLFGPCLLWLNGRPSQQLLSSCWHIISYFPKNEKVTWPWTHPLRGMIHRACTSTRQCQSVHQTWTAYFHPFQTYNEDPKFTHGSRDFHHSHSRVFCHPKAIRWYSLLGTKFEDYIYTLNHKKWHFIFDYNFG